METVFYLVYASVVMALTWLLIKGVMVVLEWLYENSVVARCIIQVLGTLCMVSIAKEIFDRKDRS
jgi:hypothetical protein